MADKKKEPKTTFELSLENALQELEEIVDTIDHRDLNLEDAVLRFERGVGLAKHCREILDQSERKITQLLPDGDEVDFE